VSASTYDIEVDVAVVGSGVAGLSTALGLSRTRRVCILEDGDGSTRWAQGGIAAAFAREDDPAWHAADSQVAGDGLCRPRALARLVEEGPLRVAELVASGARFDRVAGGGLARTLEGGHRRRRVVHAGGDATGAEVARVLEAAADAAGLARLRHARVNALTRASGPSGVRVTGLVATTPQGTVNVSARAVVLATGGIGHVYGATTNPAGVRGEGLALALLAGATLSDMEFVQFHPTALFTGPTQGQRPLVTEALRGEGAQLLGPDGEPVMAGHHPMADLAPRDVVARQVHQTMTETGVTHVWLDARRVDDVTARFPTVASSCAAVGLDLAGDLISVRPAEHFLCGGVTTDGWGATDVPGLYAVGEVAATGVHGANRLASNSLLEGLVYGARVAAALTLELPAAATGVPREPATLTDQAQVTETSRLVMDRPAGVVRNGQGLRHAAEELRPLAGQDPVWLVASAVIAAAAARPESRGCHYRRDAPRAPTHRTGRVQVRLNESGIPVALTSASAPSAPTSARGAA